MSDVLLDEDTDAVFAPNAEDTWVGVKEFSIHIRRTDYGVAVDVYAKGYEDCNAIAHANAFDSEAKEMQEEDNE